MLVSGRVMEVENHPKWKETNIGGTRFPVNHDYGRKGIRFFLVGEKMVVL